MTTETVKVVLTAEDQASAVLRKFTAEIERMKRLTKNLSSDAMKGMAGLDIGARTRESFAKVHRDGMRDLRQRFAFEDRMTRQRVAGERTVAAEQARQDRTRRTAEDASMRRLREQMSFASRMVRQRDAEERSAERERLAAAREVLRKDRYRFGLRQRYERDAARDSAHADRESARDARAADRRRADARREIYRGMGRMGEVPARLVDAARGVSVMGGLGAGALYAAGKSGLSARSRIDTAEANLRMFGGKSGDEVRAIRSDWLNRSALDYGFRPDAALNSFTEVLKAGIPDFAAKNVTKSIMGASAGLDLDVPETTKLVGRLSTLTQDLQNFDGGAIDKMLNGIAVVAKVTAADSRELVSSLRRGAGVLGSSKMSVQDLTAFTGVGISAGMQEGKAGTFMDFLVNDLVNAKGARGQRGKDLDDGFRMLGLGSRGAVSTKAANDPTAVLLKMFDNMSKMSPEKAGRAANLIGMREWRGEILMMAKAASTLRQTVEAGRDPKNAGHLKQARDERLGTLAGLRSQVVAAFDLGWEAVGGGIEDIVREIGTFFVDLAKLTDFDVLKAHVHTLVDGFVDGLGFKNVKEMLEAAFGKPGKLDYSTLQKFFEFAQGFGRGVRAVVDSIMTVLKAFTGTKADAASIGELTAKVLGFGFALAFVAPFVSVLAGLGTALVGFGIAVAAIAKSLRGAGLMGGAGAAAGAAGAKGSKLGKLGGLFGLYGLADLAKDFNTLQMPDLGKGLKRSILEAIDPGLADRILGPDTGEAKGKEPGWREPPARPGQSSSSGRDGPPHPLDAPDEKPKPKRKRISALSNPIEPAAFTSAGDIAGSVDRLVSGVREMGAQVHLAALKGTNVGASITAAAQGAASVDTGGGGSSPGMFTPEGMNVPDWYGRGRGAPGGRGSDGPARFGMGGQTFGSKAPGVMKNLMTDFGLTKEQAAGIVANLGHESAGFTAYQEKNPLVPGSRGGAGWAQWTGPRRLAFEAWSKAKGLDPRSDAANYEFLKHELNGSHAGALAAVRRQSSAGGAMVAFENQFERARIKNWDSRTRYLNQAMGLDPNGAPVNPQADPAGAVAGTPSGDGTRASSAVDIAGKYLGKNEHRHRGELSRFVGHDVAGNLNAWCARFVNASLRDAGIKGTGSAMANSFLRWGQAVDAEAVKRGDVAVEHRGRRADAGGGHVGLATGRTKRDKRSGELMVETVSGNHGDAVEIDWTPARKLALRRATDAAASAAVSAVNETAAQAKNAEQGGMDKLKGSPKATGAGGEDPTFSSSGWKKSTMDEVMSKAPPGVGRTGGGGSGRGSVTINNQLTVNGGDKSPAEIANLAQRKITEDWNHRGHDLEPELT